jgi:hypothetical protein
MKRKFIVTLGFVLLLVFAACPAFAAENVNVQLQVNGDAVPSPCLSLVEDFSMIPVDTYVSLAGAEVQWTSANDFAITENGETLSLTLGEKEALLDNSPITLPTEPFKTEDNVFIPLRAVSSAFGFVVDWNGEQWLVTLTRSETRDGMTVSDLLAKSTVASQTYNTYSMEGLFKIDMDLKADGKAIEEAPKNLTTKLTGQIQNDPLSLYMKQTIDLGAGAPVAGEEIPEMVVEMYMNQENMYMKAPGQDWMVQGMPFSPEFWKQQQDIQSDPMKAAALMKEMGILLNFGNDVSVNDKDYYVVNATLDMNKFKEVYQKLIQQAMQGMAQGAASENPQDMQEQMQKLLENATFDYSYSVLINKETLISDIINLDAHLQMTMENPEPVKTDEEINGDTPKEINMDIKMKGDFTITDLGGTFKAPDVSTAKELVTPPALNNE